MTFARHFSKAWYRIARVLPAFGEVSLEEGMISSLPRLSKVMERKIKVNQVRAHQNRD